MPIASEPEHIRAARERQVEIYRAMTPGRRLELALGMNATMRELLAAGFRDRHPEWTEVQVRHAVTERVLYARTD